LSATTAKLFRMASNVRTTWEFLRGKGLSPAQAAGVIGSMQGESGQDLNPAAVNPNGGATGIAQWLGARKNAAVMTKQLGPQLNHLWGELQGPESAALRALKAAHTPEQAAIAWQRVFERGAPFEQKYNLRAKNARNVFNQLSGVPGRASAGGGGGGGSASSGGQHDHDDVGAAGLRGAAVGAAVDRSSHAVAAAGSAVREHSGPGVRGACGDAGGVRDGERRVGSGAEARTSVRWLRR
jgi:hypothetical protein